MSNHNSSAKFDRARRARLLHAQAVRPAAVAFAEAPLGWLFLWGTALLDVALLTCGMDDWLFVVGAALAQISVATMALFRGVAHRLSRAALWVGVLLVLKVLSQQRTDALVAAHDHFFTHLAAYAAILGLLLTTCELSEAARRWRRKELRLPRPSYSLVELFAWTIIVAAASALLRGCLNVETESIAVGELLLLAVGPATAYALAVLWERSLTMTAAAGVAAISAATYLMRPPGQQVWLLHAGIFAYVLTWIGCRRLDRQTAARRAE